VSEVENKQWMQGIFGELSSGNGEPFVDAMAEDFCWTIVGTTNWSRTYRGKAAVRRDLLGPLFAQFEGRYTNTAKRILSDEDYVVVECTGRATTTAGKSYNNTYCYVIQVANGMMKELTEYCDTALLESALAPPVQL
jgi:uncharacterized protein